MHYISLHLSDLALAFVFIAISWAVSYWQKLGIERDLLWGSVRAFVQLMAVGYILQAVFDLRRWYWVVLILFVMTGIAGYNAYLRQKNRWPKLLVILFAAIGIGSILTILTVTGLILRVKPWYLPQYIIPIAGMIIGNAMTGASLATNRLSAELTQHRLEIEAALALGATSRQAAAAYLREALKTAMIPTINSMMIVGIVQLPGMMTGQIIAGTPPAEAVRYQVMVVYMIAAATAVTCILTTLWSYREYFTVDHQLKLRVGPGKF